MKPEIETGPRKVFETGGNLAVTLPKSFTEKIDIRKGDTLVYLFTGDTIRFVPLDDSHPAMKASRGH